IQRGVGLDHVVDQPPADGAERAAQRAHDARGDGTLEAERVADRDDQLPDPQRRRVTFDRFDGSSGPKGIFGAFPTGPPGSAQLEQVYVDQNGSVHFPCMCRVDSSPYAYLQGTSMSAPQVAAVAAVIRRLNPDLSGAEVVRLLKQTARQPGSGGHFWTATLGWGILDG